MQVKRYVGANMRLTLKRVREEIGPDAVILSSKRLAEGVEIMAAIEQPADVEPSSPAAADRYSDNPFKVDDNVPAKQAPSRLEQELEQWQRTNQLRARALAESIARQQSDGDQVTEHSGGTKETAAQMEAAVESEPDVVAIRAQRNTPAAEQTEARPQSVPAGGNTGAGNDADKHDVNTDVSELRREIQCMRDMLEQQLSSVAWGSYQQQQPQRAGLWRRMKRMGLSATVSQELLENLPRRSDTEDRDLWQLLMGRFARSLPVAGEDLVAAGGVFALVGATGAGKTTTIGKLATRYVLEHGPEQVALVTTDTARIAAYEQLRSFGRILNVPVKVVDKSTTLEQVLHSLRHKSLVLVDTAGLNRQDERLQKQLHGLNELYPRIKTILTLPATSQAAVIKAAYHTYKTVELAGCILTKLDEAASIGEVLSLVADKQLPVLYSTSGQAIPDDIEVADSTKLIRAAIELARPVAVNDDLMADELSSLGR